MREGSIGDDKGLGNCVLKRILQRRDRRDILVFLSRLVLRDSYAVFAHSYIREKSSIAAPRETPRV